MIQVVDDTEQIESISGGFTFLASSLPCDTSPRRLRSLWEIMNHFKATDFCIRLGNLAIFEARLESGQDDEFWGPEGTKIEFVAQIIHARNDCEAAGMADAVSLLDSILHRIKEGNPGNKVLANEARHAKDLLIKELRKRQFLYVSPERAPYLDQDDLFGVEVTTAFRSAASDIKEAGNCKAAECSTACVFHLMRAAEIGLRALAKDRNLVFADKPLDQQQWGTILGAIDGALKQLRQDDIKNWRDPEIKDIQTRFYAEVVQELRGFNEAWRRHLSHTRDSGLYDRDYAASVMRHVRAFMQKLAEKISEGVITPPYWTSK